MQKQQVSLGSPHFANFANSVQMEREISFFFANDEINETLFTRILKNYDNDDLVHRFVASEEFLSRFYPLRSKQRRFVAIDIRERGRRGIDVAEDSNVGM